MNPDRFTLPLLCVWRPTWGWTFSPLPRVGVVASETQANVEGCRLKYTLRIGVALLGGFVIATAVDTGLSLVLNSGAVRGLLHIAVWAFFAWMLWPTSRHGSGDRTGRVCAACGAVNHGSWPSCFECKTPLADAGASD